MSTPQQYLPVVVQVPAALPDTKAYLANQTAPITVVSTAVGPSDACFNITPYLSSTSFSSGSITYALTYTDEFAQPITVPLYSGVGPGPGIGLGLTFVIRAKAGTTITMATSGTFTAIYNVFGRIQQVL